MTPEEIEARRAEAQAWENSVRDLAQAYVLRGIEAGAAPVFVFFGWQREQERFYRDLCHVLGPLAVPPPRRTDILRPRASALRGQRARLIAVHQAYPWQPSGWEADDADEAAHLIDVLNRSNGWT
jgi:hypothetical protein